MENELFLAVLYLLMLTTIFFTEIYTEVNRLATQTWCVDNGFELVELNPEVEVTLMWKMTS